MYLGIISTRYVHNIKWLLHTASGRVCLGTCSTLIFSADSAREPLILLPRGWVCNVWKRRLWFDKDMLLTYWGRYKMAAKFPDDIILLWIFFNENVWISIKISLKFVPRGLINNIPTLVEIMAWRRPGDKPFSKSMTFSLLTHICVTRPQWAKETL